MTFKKLLNLFQDSFKAWSEDKASRLAAALAYYTIFSLAPLLIILVVIVGQIYGEQAAEGRIVAEIETAVSPNISDFIQTILQNASNPASSTLAAVVSILTVIWGASNIFNQLVEALNTIWEYTPDPEDNNLLALAKQRLRAFVFVPLIGLVFIAYLLLSTTVSAAGPILARELPDVVPALRLIQITELFTTFAILTLIFAVTFKTLAAVTIGWRDVWLGAAVTSLLFGLGKVLISLYISNSSVGSAYGAAGSVLVFLVWVYFSAQIFLLGAEFTHQYASQYGTLSRAPASAVAPLIPPEPPQLMAPGAMPPAQIRPADAPERREPDYGWPVVVAVSFITGLLVGLNRLTRRRR